MNSFVQPHAEALFVLEEINPAHPEVHRLEGCELCQHCTLLQVLFRLRNAKEQERLHQIQGEKCYVEQQ